MVEVPKNEIKKKKQKNKQQSLHKSISCSVTHMPMSYSTNTEQNKIGPPEKKNNAIFSILDTTMAAFYAEHITYRKRSCNARAQISETRT